MRNASQMNQLYRGGQSKGGISVISWLSVKGMYFSYIVAVNQREVFQLYRGGQSKGCISAYSWNTSLWLTATIYPKYLPLTDHHNIAEIPPFDWQPRYNWNTSLWHVFQLYRGGQSKGGISAISWWSVKGRYFSYIVAVNQREVFQLYRGGQSKGGISDISWRSVNPPRYNWNPSLWLTATI
jgi:hypothetical protein